MNNNINREKIKQNINDNQRKINCFLFNVFNNSRKDHYKFYEKPCWYCELLGKKSLYSHCVFECIRYHRDIDNLYEKFRKRNII